MIRIAVCDDTVSELETIHELVMGFIKENPESDFSVQCFQSASELLAAIDDGCIYHIFLLDIVMPAINGIDAGELIREKDEVAIIIYLSSS
ncbi:MAG: response regulator, partial [Eubacteriales bacterium]